MEKSLLTIDNLYHDNRTACCTSEQRQGDVQMGSLDIPLCDWFRHVKTKIKWIRRAAVVDRRWPSAEKRLNWLWARFEGAALRRIARAASSLCNCNNCVKCLETVWKCLCVRSWRRDKDDTRNDLRALAATRNYGGSRVIRTNETERMMQSVAIEGHFRA